jgi:hypothetical protein
MLFPSELWIRIRFDLAVLDPDLYWEYGSGSRSMEIDYLVSCCSKGLLHLQICSFAY